MSGHDTGREILWAAVRRHGLREWTISMLVGAPVHATQVDGYIAGSQPVDPKRLPACVELYTITATVIPEQDDQSGDLVITGTTRDIDEELAGAFVQAIVTAAINASDVPPGVGR